MLVSAPCGGDQPHPKRDEVRGAHGRRTQSPVTSDGILPVQMLALTKHLGNISSRRPGVSYSRGTYSSVHVHMCACNVLNTVRVRRMLVLAGPTTKHGLDVVSASSACDRDVVNMVNVQASRASRLCACISVVMCGAC